MAKAEKKERPLPPWLIKKTEKKKPAKKPAKKKSK